MRCFSIAAGVLLAALLIEEGGYGQDNGYSTGSEPGVSPLSEDYATPAEGSAAENGPEAAVDPFRTRLLSTRHFEFIVWPQGKPVPGSMEDTSISLGEYARQLRAERQTTEQPSEPAPGAMAKPAAPR